MKTSELIMVNIADEIKKAMNFPESYHAGIIVKMRSMNVEATFPLNSDHLRKVVISEKTVTIAGINFNRVTLDVEVVIPVLIH